MKFVGLESGNFNTTKRCSAKKRGSLYGEPHVGVFIPRLLWRLRKLIYPMVLKTEINNINQLKLFLKKEKITSMLMGPGSGKNKKIKEITKLILPVNKKTREAK